MGKEYWVTWPNFDMKMSLESCCYQFGYGINVWFISFELLNLFESRLQEVTRTWLSPMVTIHTQTGSTRIVRETFVSQRLVMWPNIPQDSLLVKCRNDNHSPGPMIGELVSSSHQRSELSNTILCIFSRWNQRIGEGIPIPDSLGEATTFINICISNGSLKCHSVLISSTPSFGDKVIC